MRRNTGVSDIPVPLSTSLTPLLVTLTHIINNIIITFRQADQREQVNQLILRLKVSTDLNFHETEWRVMQRDGQ